MSFNAANLLKVVPDIPMDFANAVHDLGLILLNDDIHDIGYFTYYNRRTHIYKGKRAPHHPSPFHHWQIAILMLVSAKVLGMVSLARENIEAYHEIEMEETRASRQVNYKEYMSQMERNGYKNSTIRDRPIEHTDYEVVDMPENVKVEPSGVLPPVKTIPRKKLLEKMPKLSITL